MKFISKNANLRIVLRHAIPPEPITGRLGVPGLHIKFENGIAVSKSMGDFSEEKVTEMMLAHSGFDRDYVAVKEDQTDPYKGSRRENEPDHQITELKYGHAENIQGSSHNVRLDPKLKDVAQKMAIEMAKEMAPQLAKDMLLEMAKQSKAKKAQEENTREAATPEESVPAEEENVVDEVEGVVFECSYCGKTAKSKAGLAAHERTCKAKVAKEQ